MKNWKPAPAPFSIKHTNELTASSPKFHDPSFFCFLVRPLPYKTITPPELSFAINSVCQAMHHPTDRDFASIKRIIRYLQGLATASLHLRKSNLTLLAFCNSDWAANPRDRQSMTENLIFLGRNPIL